MTSLTTTRRGVLGRALVLAAGALGAGSAAGTAAGATPVPPATRKLIARHFLTREVARRYALLLDESGKAVGHLAGVVTFLDSSVHEPGGPPAIEWHTLTLEEGTLSAQGVTRDGEGTFHLIGGTGGYAGVRGSYELRPDRSAAELVLTTTPGEVR